MKKADRQSVMEKAAELAMTYEKRFTGCSQSTVAGLLDALDIDETDVFKTASGLADGIGLSGDGTCGALIGSAMVIGLIFGRGYKDHFNVLAPMKSYRLSRKIQKDFMKQYGSCRCYDIQKKLMGRTYDLMNPQDMKAAVGEKMVEHCAQVVGRSARLTAGVILREQALPKVLDYPLYWSGKISGVVLRKWG